MLSEAHIAEIKKRKDAATPGPWIQGEPVDELKVYDDLGFGIAEAASSGIRTDEERADNIAFIAHSITDVSDLLDEREEMVRKTAKRCLEIVNAEHLEHDSDETESESDEAYNAALEDIANLIRREFELPVAPEGK